MVLLEFAGGGSGPPLFFFFFAKHQFGIFCDALLQGLINYIGANLSVKGFMC